MLAGKKFIRVRSILKHHFKYGEVQNIYIKTKIRVTFYLTLFLSASALSLLTLSTPHAMYVSTWNGLSENFMTRFTENSRILNPRRSNWCDYIIYFIKYKYTNTHMYNNYKQHIVAQVYYWFVNFMSNVHTSSIRS